MGLTASAQTMLVPSVQTRAGWCVTIWAHSTSPHARMHWTRALRRSRWEGTLKLVVSRVVRKPAFCICENKDADQLRGDREADQRLCFRYTDSTILLLPKSEISSL